jgi:AraC-like DNA-binding protein
MLKNPNFLFKSPEISDENESFHVRPEADVLADVLKSLGLCGRVFCRAKMKSPWSLAIPFDRMAHFHYIERGVCRLELDAMKDVYTLTAGDIAVLPRGPGHLLYDAPGRTSVSIRELVKDEPQINGCSLIQYGGMGAETQMLCGSFQFRHGREGFLLPLLPDVIILSSMGEGSHALLESTLRFIATEAGQQMPGNQIVLTRLVEILFVQVLRSWLDKNTGESSGNWLNALHDDRIVAALGRIHARPEHPWTVASMAACANMSRSPFAALFKKLVGEAPLTYLRRWRLRTAAGLLEETNLPLPEIAFHAGYRSETSFSKTFKESTGYSPIQYRRRAKHTSDGAGQP